MPPNILDISLAEIVDLLVDAVCVINPEGCFMFVSASGEKIFDYTQAEMLGRPMIDFVHPDDRARTLDQCDKVMSWKSQPYFYNRHLRKDGQTVHVMWSARWSPSSRVQVLLARDVTALRRAKAQQAARNAISEAAYTAADLPSLSAQIHRTLGRLMPVARLCVALHDPLAGVLRFVCYRDPYGMGVLPLEGAPTISAEVVCSGRPLLLTPQGRAGRPGPPNADVDPRTLDWLGVPLFGTDGPVGTLSVQNLPGQSRYSRADAELLEFVATQFASALDRLRTEARLQQMAGHDSLTGLPNRALLDDRLRMAVERAQRDGTRLGLLFVDLDRFREVDDTLGHAAGDRVLQEAAWRLSLCVRASDTAGRLGRDEFLLLLHDVHSAAYAEAVAEAIRDVLRQSFEVEGRPVAMSASIGVLLYPDSCGDSSQLLQRADAAMRRAKQQGGDRSWTAVPEHYDHQLSHERN